MIDIHCHILPYLDDGPQRMTESLDMANSAVRAGITHLFATPHHLNGKYENDKRIILNRVHEFNQYLMNKEIPLIVLPGQELRIQRELYNSPEMGEVLTLDDKGKFLLLELPSGEVPSYTQEVVYELLLNEIIPIIVHPERNRGFMKDHNQLFELVQEGALTQLTSGSIVGQFGKKIQSFSEKMIEHNWVHFVASDAHNVHSRGFSLHEAYRTITETFGSNRTIYFKDNAELLLRGQDPFIDDPIPSRKKILGVF